MMAVRVRSTSTWRTQTAPLFFPTRMRRLQSWGWMGWRVKVLQNVRPTPEQLQVIQDDKLGVTAIRGAAGSGKTTTALFRLRFLVNVWVNRREREGHQDPIVILVLTYNRTLRGYISELARQQLPLVSGLDLTISTFGKWAYEELNRPPLVKDRKRRDVLGTLTSALSLDPDFLSEEVDYVLGRFTPESLQGYLDVERTGRGRSPRVDKSTRKKLLDEVILPYQEWKQSVGQIDWTDAAVRMTNRKISSSIDVLIVDESQDFSANQVRALLRQTSADYSATFILDSAQQIYPRSFTWREVGVSINSSYRLAANHRNTVEIARFALPLLDGVELGDNATLPDFRSCTEHGSTPIVVKGPFSRQTDYIVEYIKRAVNLADESVAILLPKGGDWFSYIKRRLTEASLRYVILQRESEWPSGPENIGLSTLHSAKGLEFDHVLILGLNAELMPHGSEEDDAQLDNHRRLVAMAIGRAKRSVIVGYKPEEASSVVGYLDPSTHRTVDL